MIFKIKELEQHRAVMMSYINLKHRKFSYALERNIERFDSEIKKASAKAYADPSFEHSPKFSEYIKQLNALEAKYSQLDENGKVKRNANGDIIPTKPTLYKKALKALQSENQIAIEILEDRKKVIRTIENSEVDIKVYLIQQDEMLPDEFSAQDRKNLRFMFVPEMKPDAVLEE